MQSQQELTLIAGMDSHINELPTDVLLPCRTYQDAMRVSMRLSRVRRSDGDWAYLMGYDQGQWSRILNCDLEAGGKGKAFLNPTKDTLFYRLTGNYGLLQWRVLEAKGMLNHQRMNKDQQRLEALRAEIAELERATG